MTLMSVWWSTMIPLLSATGHVSDGIQGHSRWAGGRRNSVATLIIWAVAIGLRRPARVSTQARPRRAENRNIGVVHAGQDVAVKVQMFDFTRHGLLHGHVVDVSREGDAQEAAGSPDAKDEAAVRGDACGLCA